MSNNPYRDKLLSIGYLSRGLSKPKIIEGRDHPESHVSFKTTSDETGSITEHSNDRVDACVRPKSLRVVKVRDGTFERQE